MSDDLLNASLEVINNVTREVSSSISNGIEAINAAFRGFYNELERSIEHGARTGVWP